MYKFQATMYCYHTLSHMRMAESAGVKFIKVSYLKMDSQYSLTIIFLGEDTENMNVYKRFEIF